MKDLTTRQNDLLSYIRSFLLERKFPPTFREISDHFGMSVRGAYDHLKALEKKGAIRWDKNRSRSLELLDDPDPAPRVVHPEVIQIVQVPILGTVVAGIPLASEENFDGYLPLPAAMVRNEQYFALRVKGSSMINAGINEGDMAIIRQQSTANNGEIVVAMIDDSITLKRFYKEANRVQLKAENPDFPPIFTRDVRILGKLAHILRTY